MVYYDGGAGVRSGDRAEVFLASVPIGQALIEYITLFSPHTAFPSPIDMI